jgi:putative SOS response-associated peptidase YedK
MCGRFAMDNSTTQLLEEIVNAHGLSALKDWQQYWPPNYNVAPTQDIPVAYQRDGSRGVDSVRWGMVAPYAKEFGGKPTINARIETVATNGVFKGPFRDHRVVVPALGYYEWQEREDGKQPYFIHMPGEPLALAGIVRTWHDKTKDEGDPEWERLSMAIITLDAHVTPGEVHDREPAFLIPDVIDDWLAGELAPDQLVDLLQHSSAAVADQLEYFEVSRSVNKVQKSKGAPNDGPELIEPIYSAPERDVLCPDTSVSARLRLSDCRKFVA